MKKVYIFLYFIVVSIPLLMGLVIWQSTRYQNLYREVQRLDTVQSEWIESNKRLIAGIAQYSSPERIVGIAVNQLELQKIRPENKLQVIITGGEKGHEY